MLFFVRSIPYFFFWLIPHEIYFWVFFAFPPSALSSFAVFPRIDFSHHPAIQQILFKTCDEFGVKYVAGSWWEIYKEMIVSFRNPQSLMQEIVAQAGGV